MNGKNTGDFSNENWNKNNPMLLITAIFQKVTKLNPYYLHRYIKYD